MTPHCEGWDWLRHAGPMRRKTHVFLPKRWRQCILRPCGPVRSPPRRTVLCRRVSRVRTGFRQCEFVLTQFELNSAMIPIRQRQRLPR